MGASISLQDKFAEPESYVQGLSNFSCPMGFASRISILKQILFSVFQSQRCGCGKGLEALFVSLRALLDYVINPANGLLM